MRKRSEDFPLGTLLADRGAVTLARYLGVPIDRLDSLALDYDALFVVPAENRPPGLKERFFVDFKGARDSDAKTFPFEVGNEYEDGSFKKTWGLTSNADYIGVVFYDEHDPETGKGSLALVDLPEWRGMWLDGRHKDCCMAHVCPKDSLSRWPIKPNLKWQQAKDGTWYRTWNAYPSLSDLGGAVRLRIDHLEPVTWAPVPCSLLLADRVSLRKGGDKFLGSRAALVSLIEHLASGRDKLSPPIQEPVAYFFSTLVSSRRVQNLSPEGKLLFYMSIMLAHYYDGTVPADREKFNKHVNFKFSPDDWKQAVKELLLASLWGRHGDGFAPRNWSSYQKERRPLS